jgi:hypothetical protein
MVLTSHKEKIMEIWKEIAGWEDYYEASNFGNVRSKIRKGKTAFGERLYGGKVLSPFVHLNGYLTVNLTIAGKRKQYSVHRLIAETFLGQCPNAMECCHNNGVTTDNKIENLRWDTPKNNHADKIKHGTWGGGQNSASAKLNEQQAKNVKYSKKPLAYFAEKYNMSISGLGKIRYGESWKHI